MENLSMKKLIKYIWKYNRVWLIVSLVIVLIVTSHRSL